MTHQQLYINIHHVNSKVQNCYQTGETFPLNKGSSCVPADHKRPQWMVIRSSHWEARREIFCKVDGSAIMTLRLVGAGVALRTCRNLSRWERLPVAAGYDERFASGNDEMVVTGNDDEGWLGTDEARLHSRASFLKFFSF